MGRYLYPDYFVQEEPGDWCDIYGTEPVDNSYIPGGADPEPEPDPKPEPEEPPAE